MLPPRSTNRLDYEQAARPIAAMPKDYPCGHVVDLHRHNRGQIIFAAAGVMEIETTGDLWLLPPQRALWMPAGIDHLMRARSQVSLRTVYIRTDACPADFPNTPKAIQVPALLRELLLRAAAMPLDYDETGRDGRLLALLLEEIAWAPEPALPLPTSRDRRLERICQAILAEPADNRRLDEWAALVGASTRTLTRLFHAELGMSFVAWRLQAKAFAALPRLAAGEPVTIIAADLGYETPGAFSAMFRRLMGQAPSRYFA
ncbi:helix-turn-helix transcriptional regulator [Telmatospirillum sp.]|uniref:AraC family transcriptional regulator n=1 Tax=Telmatospirillum sp. TaxID=2079197 RepID=UPI00283DAAE5|nr:helix-turn-helix transcriptional regulator [Telmatospirillum sp.]MDR3440037.1 helix-turn-helix transcriptional regulator [Telmatospirillum sp.]